MTLFVGLSFACGILLVVSAFSTSQQPRVRTSRTLRKPHTVPLTIWPEVVDDLASAVRAGMSLPQAIEQLSLNGPAELKSAFADCVRSYRVTGDLVSSLNGIARHCNQASADKFVSALHIAHSVGGADLGVVLRGLSEVLREDLNTRSEITARQSWTVNGARLAVAAPWVTALVLSARGDTARVYLSTGGIRILVLCAFVSVLAYFTMWTISRLPEEPRVLTS